ncbi:Acetyltransferase (GNAT) domain-containing protein [Amphibacillus marinus]|uniref:Acetyltransferase (GNAT) domain-containing protein n=1 Tax=Amphibacillus marinus TaxID=872970 RepID=A0A1H8KAI9_9BACI|nr:GNAT family N-acetyltransferase [Amphibacillus marinus]SEN89990.1 Acetyltransferase (GNAT) domain-containing protein [Amphibacillus marinus]
MYDRISYQPPEPQAYIDLRVAAGMSTKSLEAARVGLQHALFTVCIYDQDQLIGLGRIIGDGGTVFQIVDVVVKPDYQGKGLGKTIMKELTVYLDHHTYVGSYVSLIADVPADRLYQQFGFNYTAPRSQGMYKMYKNAQDTF